MRLIKMTTRHTDEEIEAIVKSNPIESDTLEGILRGIEFSEFLDENGFTSILCIMSDYDTKRLVDTYVNLSIDFSIEDLTKKVLFSEKVKVDYFDEGTSVSNEINTLISKFYKDNIDVNTILDKISFKGIASLTTFDKEVLGKF